MIASGCIWMPNNRTEHEKGDGLTLTGYAGGPNVSVQIRARNYSTGANDVLTSVVSSNTEIAPGSSLYLWTATLTNLVTSSDYWHPPDLGTLSAGTSSPGRLELTAFAGATRYVTFSEAAADCVGDRLVLGDTLMQAGEACHDGSEVALFDNSGAANSPDVDDTITFVTTDADLDIEWSVISYESQGLTVYGYFCRPLAPGIGAGHPVHIINHGGAGGLFEQSDLAQCQLQARQGFIAAMSAYRGEPIWPVLPNPLPDPPPAPLYESDGEIEMCLGEVTDVLRLIEVIDASVADADMDRVLMTGISHGGCITTRAVERGAPVAAAVDFFGPSDWSLLYDECSGAFCTDIAVPLLESVTGGTPITHPQAYDWRSPRWHDGLSDLFAGDLGARNDVKFVIFQGAADPLVLPNQSCLLAEDAWGSDSQRFHVDAMGAETNAAVAGCSQSWTAGARPTNVWDQQRYLLVYDGVGHAANLTMLTDYVNFVVSLGW